MLKTTRISSLLSRFRVNVILRSVMDESKMTKKDALRFAVPPHFIGVLFPKGMDVLFSGSAYKALERRFAPSPKEIQDLLINLRLKLRWSRPRMAALLGASEHAVRAWETGSRQPSGAARRLIWLLDLMLREPGDIKGALEVIFWGFGKNGPTLAHLSNNESEVDG
jgi:DNA-binding transcriptional regulator YiaG